MKKILIVDNDPEIRNTLTSALAGVDGFRVLSQESPAIALKLCQIQRVDVLILDAGLPGGIKLLSQVRPCSPETLIIAIADSFPEELKMTLERLGASHYLAKPVSVDTLVNLIQQDGRVRPQSMVKGLSLTSFLQLINLEQKTCTLVVNCNEGQGRIFCETGNVIGASTGETCGHDAFYRMIAWNAPDIAVIEGMPGVVKDIHLPLMHLLMESHQRMDESGPPLSESKPVDPPGETKTAPGSKAKPSLEDAKAVIQGSPMAPKLQKMQAALLKIAGPIAKFIFLDAVREWIGACSASESSLPVLTDILAKGINDPAKELAYRKMISE